MIKGINNLPRYATEDKYIVARAVDGEYWFWGSWDADHGEDAYNAAIEIDGQVFINE